MRQARTCLPLFPRRLLWHHEKIAGKRPSQREVSKMDERTSLSRRKLLHTLAGTGVIAAADLAWWDAPFIAPRKAWAAEPVRFQWSVPEPTRIALMNSLAERFNQSQKDFAVQIEYVPQAQARQKLISSITGGSPPDLCQVW